MTLQDIRFLLYEGLELFFIADFGVVSDSDKGQQVLVYRDRIDSREITSDDSLAFEALYSRVNCRGGEAEPLANRGVSNSSIVLNQRKYFKVNRIHIVAG